MPRPLFATIHLDSMQHNLARARSCAPLAKIWAVVKADAYGHGLERALRGFATADGLALVELESAIRLRELGWIKPILLLEGFFEAADVPMLAEHNIATAVHSIEQVKLLEYTQLYRPIDVYLKMNTGMNRLGFPPAEYAAAWQRLRAIRDVRSITHMTHFANADELEHPRLTIAEQVRRFQLGAADLAGERSLSNSGGVLHQAELADQLSNDWVRPGIMLYGGTPGGRSAQDFGLRPTMTLRSEVIGIQHIGPGDTVGYGSRFEADGPMTIGVVACGYADGYPRSAPHGTPVIVDGVRTTLVGRVSMDMMTVDLTPVPNARIGSKVTLWGDGLPIDDVAQAAGTIGYELMCALAPRVRVTEGRLGTDG
ncbi:alanine racemase [Massilia sp. UYP32]|jgi:alanine racemase|uniref:Alanine racemase n=1 Tax=Massilia timonae CCUG 45783 TaxID=883126 RepID=K9DTE6_9BURK|nr:MULTISPECIES: alanine racemase [Massilia]EKU80650.1 alanine racemase [Massilia timonae CCUG 45783]QYG02200.1 alanine racemase [Massilia sp. NP310]